MIKKFKYSFVVLLFIGMAACVKAEDRPAAVPAEPKPAVETPVSVAAVSDPTSADTIGVIEEEIKDNMPAIEEQSESPVNQITDADLLSLSMEEIVKKSWEASFRNEEAQLDELVSVCLHRFDGEARKQQSLLTGFPAREEAENYKILNDVATCRFIKAEYLMNHGKKEEAIVKFQEIIDDYGWAQAWDPSRGAYWSVSEKSQDSIDVLTGKREEKMQQQFVKVERTKPVLNEPGTEQIIDYTKFGELTHVGTEEYRFVPSDIVGLAQATGEGIYPNKSSIYNNPRYKEVRAEGRLGGSHWDFVNTNDLEAAYFKWATAPEPEGLKLYFLGLIFEKSEMPYEALRAYHALVVHFPKTVGYTYWQTPWYPAQAAIAKIRHILRLHPELDLVDQWMKIEVQNGFDNMTENDKFIVYPGRIVKRSLIDTVKDKFSLEDKVDLGKVQREIGSGAVRLVQYENKHWQLLVNNQPYPIKAITYAPTTIGQSPDKGTLENWMVEDTNKNGIIDGPHEAWVDKNLNNTQDADEPVVGDFKLMKEMGANTLRIYHHPKKPNKELLRKMYEEYGFRVIMGDFLGKYAIGSGASWTEGTDYENEAHKAAMLESVKEMVMEFKDEPYILLWVLGNENNYGVACNADKKPEAYYKFVNEVARWIKSVDPNHPVAVNNGDTLFLDIFAKNAPDVDIFSANVYRGDYGFGSFWEQVAYAVSKPAYISEFGAPAFAAHLTLEEADQAQADYHRGNWMDIEANMAGRLNGTGNSLGGVVFEWLDEWWKNYEPFLHDRKSDAVGPFPGGYYFEEWFGIVGQGNGRNSPFMRQPRKSYFLYKEFWNKL